jgi:lipopolysaccharide biosynthesis glycosyltransferase
MPKEYMGTHIKELKLKKKQYFNAGMLLINLDKWKQFDVSKKCLSLLSKRVFKFNDQDVLNIVLQDQCKWLP